MIRINRSRPRRRVLSEAKSRISAGGAKSITPHWRTLKTAGELNPKYPGGIPNLRKKLTAEGHRVIARGKHSFVADYEKSLIKA